MLPRALTNRWGAWALALLVLFPLTGVAAGAAPSAPSPLSAVNDAALTGTPTLGSTYVVGHGAAIVFVGAESWEAVWEPVSNGSQVYSNALLLIAFGLKSTPVSLTVDAWEATHGWVENQSIILSPLNQTVITVTVANDQAWRQVVVYMDGIPFVATMAVPYSLLPPSVLNVGGLDILVLAVASEGIIVFAGMVGLARMAQKKARFAPKFSLLFYGHVLLLGLIGLVVVDYQFVDQTFAGWSPLFYAFLLGPMEFVTALSWFNDSKKAELLQRVARPNGSILYRRWLLRFAVLPDGRTILVDERWRGWLARLFGKFPTIDKGDELTPVPFEGKFALMRSPTQTHGVERISDRFRVANPQEDDVLLLWWTETGDPVTVKWPHLTIHGIRHVPAKRNSEGVVLEDEHDEPRLTLPHYVDAEVELKRALEDYGAVEAISAGWANIRDLARVLSQVKTALHALRAGFEGQVNAEVESRLLTYYSLLARLTADLTDQEAEAEAKRGQTVPTLAELLGEERLRAGPAPPPKKGEKR